LEIKNAGEAKKRALTVKSLYINDNSKITSLEPISIMEKLAEFN